MARKVLDFENRILDLDVDLFIAMPKMYRDQSGPDTSPNDEIGKAWDAASKAVLLASFMLSNLGDLQRARAGIKEPGPLQQLCPPRSEPESQPVLAMPDNNGANGEAA